ncbi:LacI family DNA-binding transcriptional regulator [Stella sp.]|uniref:LacI family DNA-binding transcriptional regulator n=1 Tax=Stella sp. TaxID=2912054 RepID=UPI0035B4CCE4
MSSGRRGSGWVTMADVARRAGVSPMTVSRAFKTPALVSEPVRERVAAAAAALGYVPNLVAGNLASSRSRMVAAVVPTLANSNFLGTLKGLSDRLRQEGYQLLLTETGYDRRQEAAAVAALLGRRPDGIVLTGAEHDPAVGRMLRAAHVAVVETWDLRGPFIDMAVGFSHQAAALALGRLVVARGHRRIGYIDFPHPELRRFRARRRGVRQALREAGLDPSLIVGVADEGYGGGQSGLDALLAQAPDLDAVVCATDVQAVGVLFECARRSLAVPDRLGVAGFGDFEIAAAVPPGLTSVRTNGRGIGIAAAELILARQEGGRPGAPVIDLGFEIVSRGSLRSGGGLRPAGR